LGLVSLQNVRQRHDLNDSAAAIPYFASSQFAVRRWKQVHAWNIKSFCTFRQHDDLQRWQGKSFDHDCQ
jgi:hypothetical protein